MRYSYEFKKKCVELYRDGKWPETPAGVNQSTFRCQIRQWNCKEAANGVKSLKAKNKHTHWSPDFKYELVLQVINGRRNQEVALEAGIDPGMLCRWVRNYKSLGYNGLVRKRKGETRNEPVMKKITSNKTKRLDETEREELLRLRAENEAIKAEIEVIKKEIALREKREAARLKAKKQRSLKNS